MIKQDDIRWIEQVLSNDENSTDEELIDYFKANGLTERQAIWAVSHRDAYLNDVVFDGQGPLWETQ